MWVCPYDVNDVYKNTHGKLETKGLERWRGGESDGEAGRAMERRGERWRGGESDGEVGRAMDRPIS